MLKAVPLFSSLSDEEVRVLGTCLQQRRYPRGSFILRVGEEIDALYVIVSGRVKVVIPAEQGHEVILTVLGPTEYFGEMGLLDDKRRSASVETLVACEMLRFPKAAFVNCLKDNFELAMILIRNLVERLRRADRSIESLALYDVYGRVVRLLRDQAVQIDGLWVVNHAPAKQEMARMIGASREMVSRVMKDLQRRGQIRVEKRKVILVDNISANRRASTGKSTQAVRHERRMGQLNSV
jgi:CRP/FNR family cyclic AMP-dependent transcriptional regulator